MAQLGHERKRCFDNMRDEKVRLGFELTQIHTKVLYTHNKKNVYLHTLITHTTSYYTHTLLTLFNNLSASKKIG